MYTQRRPRKHLLPQLWEEIILWEEPKHFYRALWSHHILGQPSNEKVRSLNWCYNGSEASWCGRKTVWYCQNRQKVESSSQNILTCESCGIGRLIMVFLEVKQKAILLIIIWCVWAEILVKWTNTPESEKLRVTIIQSILIVEPVYSSRISITQDLCCISLSKPSTMYSRIFHQSKVNQIKEITGTLDDYWTSALK